MSFTNHSTAPFEPSVQRIEEGWRIRPDDGEPQWSPDLDDAGWPLGRVPHFREEGSKELPSSRRSLWYRHRFTLAMPPPGWRVLLEVVDAREVQAWVNGREAARSRPESGYLCQDITGLAREGGNALALCVRNPGIRNSLSIRVVPPVAFQPQKLFVDAPNWKGGPAPVRIRHTAVNTSGAPARCRIRARVLGPDDQELASIESEEQTIAPGASASFELNTPRIADPPLWSLETPNLCRVVVELEAGGERVHDDETRFGFRWFEFTADKGFFLNGKHVKLHGTVYINVPRGMGHASREAFWEYEIGILKTMGVNFVRPAEGADETTIEQCDRAGMLVVTEAHDEGTPEILKEILPSEIAPKYNSPSVIAWTFNGEGKNANQAARQSEVARLLRELDPTRPVCCVELGWRAQGAIGLTDCDVAGQGNYTGWYEGTREHIGPYMDDYRQLLAERYGSPLPMIVSNYGAAADPLIHTDHPRRNDYSEEYHTAFHKRFIKEIESRDWLAGGLIFCFRDIDGGQGIPRHTWKGVVDRHERRRDAYYYYQSQWTDAPMAHIATKDWSPREVWPMGATRRYEVFSNGDTVELFHNGKSLGTQSKAEGFAWDVPVAEGSNDLRAVAAKGGDTVEDTASIEIRFVPPAPEPRLVSTRNGDDAPRLKLLWDAIEGIDDVVAHAGDTPDFEPSDKSRIGAAKEGPIEAPSPKRGTHFRLTATGGDRTGEPSIALGWGEGALRWRFANEGWLRSAPALVNLNGDGRREIVFGSYDGCVYALRCDGTLLWKYQPPIVECVIGAVAAAPLAHGEPPSIIVSSSKAVYVLAHDGSLRWRREGHRTYDRSTKSPAAADIDGDGRLEILAPSDTGEFQAFDADGKPLWTFATAQPGHRGIAQTTPVVVPSSGGPRIVFSADDGMTYCLDAMGALVWRFDNQVGGNFPGSPPTPLTPCAGALEEGGPTLILLGSRGLKALDPDGSLAFERRDVSGVPVIADLFKDGKRQIVIGAGKELRVHDSEGGRLWAFPFEGRGNFITSSVVIADTDDDGSRELLVGARDTYLYAIGSDGSVRWRAKTWDEVSASPSVADIDNDGFMEIVSGSRDGYMRCIGGGKAPQRPLELTQYRGGLDRKGDYS